MVESIFGLTFTGLGEADLARAIARDAIPQGQGPRVVVTANLDHVVTLSRSPEFRRAYGRAAVVTADGMPVYLYAKLRGLPVPGRVTGADLCWRILDGVAPGRHRLFFIVSTVAVAASIRSEMLRRGFSPAELAFRVPPPGFETDAAATGEMASSIAGHGTTHLFLGVGSPKSEIWTDTVRDRIGDCYVLNFGAGLEYFAGTRARAPRILRDSGLEWAWRLAAEPKRLFRRYLVHSWRFLWVVGLDLSGRRA